MKLNFSLTGVLVLTLCAITRVQSQTVLDLPYASQAAQVKQRVGVTDITITYHRPVVNGRKIWGKLVPYGQVWRAGANENTTIEFSDPVMIEGKQLARGICGLHMIPGESEWTLIFSKAATAWGSFSYKQQEDALRVSVRPQPSEFREAQVFDFDDVKPESTLVSMRWEKVTVPFRIGVAVADVVQADLQKQ